MKKKTGDTPSVTLNRLFQKMDEGLCYTPGVVIMFGAGLVRKL